MKSIFETQWYEFYKNIFTEEQLNILETHLHAKPKKALRIMSKRLDVQKFRQLSIKKDWNCTPIEWSENGFYIERNDESVPIGKDILHLSGQLYLQDASSQLPVTLFEASHGTSGVVLDMCSAPGSKTTQLVDLLDERTLIIANDAESSRVSGLISNLERCGGKNVVVTKYRGGLWGKAYPNTFDKILLDAPCSGDGMMKKDVRCLASWSVKKSKQIAKTQKELILSAFEALKPGGELIYSTCSFSPYENEEVVQYLIETYDDAVETENISHITSHPLQEFDGKQYDSRVTNAIRLHPWEHDAEGFFVIKIRKNKPTEKNKNKYFSCTYEELPKKKEQIICSYVKKHFGIEFTVPKRYILLVWQKEIWLVLEKFFHVFPSISSPHPGMMIGSLHDHKFRISHAFCLEYGNQATKLRYALSQNQCEEIFEGKDIEIENVENWKEGDIVILQWESQTIGYGKYLDGKIKNCLPREVIKKA